jgi:hypothetical protein
MSFSTVTEAATVPIHASIQKKILHVLYLDELLKSSPWHPRNKNKKNKNKLYCVYTLHIVPIYLIIVMSLPLMVP